MPTLRKAKRYPITLFICFAQLPQCVQSLRLPSSWQFAHFAIFPQVQIALCAPGHRAKVVTLMLSKPQSATFQAIPSHS